MKSSSMHRIFFEKIIRICIILFFILVFSNCIEARIHNRQADSPSILRTQDYIDDQFEIPIGSKHIMINCQNYTLKAPVIRVEDHSYIPLRFFLDYLNAQEIQYTREPEIISFIIKRCKDLYSSKFQSVKFPIGLNDTVRVEVDCWHAGKVIYDIEMLELIHGNKAWSIINSANQNNDIPGKDKEYILAKFRVLVLSTEIDKSYSISHTNFDVFSPTKGEYFNFVALSGIEPNLQTDLLQGSEHIGWTYFLVDKSDRPLAILNKDSLQKVYFDLRTQTLENIK